MSEKRGAIIIVFIMLLNFLLPVSAFAGPAEIAALRNVPDLRERELNGVEVKQNKNGGFFISGQIGKLNNTDEVPGMLVNQKKLFNFSSSSKLTYKVKKVIKDELNMTHVRTRQYFNGIPIYGKEVVVHVNGNGEITSVNGNVVEKVSAPSTPSISTDEAIKIAGQTLNTSTIEKSPTSRNPREFEIVTKTKGSEESSIFKEKLLTYNVTDSAELVIYEQNGRQYLTYVVDISNIKPQIQKWKVFVDAVSGEVLRKVDLSKRFTSTTGYGYGYYGDYRALKIIKDYGYYSLIGKTASDQYYHKNIFGTADWVIAVYYPDYDPFYADNDTLFDHPIQAKGVDAHYYTEVVHNYFKSKHGRNSYDGQGSPVLSFANYTENPINAAYMGDGIFVYGSGGYDSWSGKEWAPFSSGLDVIAHEYTHAVSDSSAGFMPWDESGAMSESFSDVFASIIDPDWELGEDIITPGISGDAIRDMSDPMKYGQPDHYDNYIFTYEDNGGVHYNSGIPNKAFYNIVTELGSREIAAKIYYRALTLYLTPDSGFYDTKWALVQAADDLGYKYKSPVYNAIVNGWGAVGVCDPYELNLGQSPITLVRGTEKPLQVTLTWDDGYVHDITGVESILWTTSNSNVATVNELGVITGVSKGSAVITANLWGATASVTVNVTPAIISFTVDKASASLVAGGPTLSLKTTAFYDDGTKADVTKTAIWESLNPLVAEVNLGVIKGNSKGETEISVTYGTNSLNIPVNVSPALTELSVNSPVLNMTTGDVDPLSCTATYVDESEEDVTQYTLWNSSNVKVATVSANGLISAVGKGKAIVTGKYLNKSIKVTVEVTPPVERLGTDKTTTAVVVGGSKAKIKLIAYYNDGTKADVTKKAIWEVADQAIASVQAGSVTGLSRGNTNILVSYKDKSISVPVAVTPKVDRLVAEYADLDLTTGEEPTRVSLRAYYNDGTDEDVTEKASWKTSKATIADVSEGLIYPVAKGKANVSAQFNGKQAKIKVNVTPPVDSIVISKPNLQLTTGSANKLLVTAYYIDGSKANVTTSASALWESSNESVITVNRGQIKAVATGDAVVTVRYKGVSAESSIRVRPAVNSLTGPSTIELLAGNMGQTVQITANYSDGSTEDVTELCTFTSSNNNVAVVSEGVITPVGTGLASIIVKYGGKAFTIKVTVS